MNYRSASLHVTRTNDGAWVTAEESGVARWLSSEEFRVLCALEEFSDIETHARAISRISQGVQASSGNRTLRLVFESLRRLQSRLRNNASANGTRDLARLLTRFKDDGLLVCYEDNLANFQTRESAVRATAVTTFAVVTRDRPALLRRCLDSIGRSLLNSLDPPLVVVFDDSGENLVSENEVVISEWTRGNRISARHYTAQAKRELKGRIHERSGVPDDVLDFALFDPYNHGYTLGANLNSLLLESSGEIVLTIDDDLVCDLKVPPDQASGLSVRSCNDPTEIWFSADEAPAVEAKTGDYVAIYRDVLGQQISYLARATSARDEDVSMEGTSRRFFSRLLAADCRIAAAMMGVVGNAGVQSPRWFLLDGSSLNRLTASREAYKCWARTPSVIRATPRTTISDGAFFMNGSAGLDNTRVLPPFFPVFRNCDGVFGCLLSRCAYGDAIAYLPWAVPHRPEGRQIVPDSDTIVSVWPRMSDLLMCLIKSCGVVSSPMHSTAECLRYVGVYLSELGGSSERDFRRTVTFSVRRELVSFLAQLEDRGARCVECLDLWREDIRRFSLVLKEIISAEDLSIPREFLTGRLFRDACNHTRQLVKDFGRLLICWPEMLAAARPDS
jgi:hypothetical protein